MVDKGLVGTGGELIFRDSERVGNTQVRTVHHFRGNGCTDCIVVNPVDQLADTVLNVTLGNKQSLVGIVEVSDTDGSVLQLVNHVTFELIRTLIVSQRVERFNRNSGNMDNRIRLTRCSVCKRGVILVNIGDRTQRSRNLRIKFRISLMIVVSLRIIVGEVDDQLILKFTDSDIRSVRTVQCLETVLKEGLTLIISAFQQIHGSLGTTLGCTCPRNTDGDVVDRTGLQGEGTGRLHETTVVRSVVHIGLCPTISTIL